MRIGILTAGGAGMFCGACMHDNTWARALTRAGCEVLLLPAYTPIRVDERNVSTRRVFLGGVNLYLRQRFGWWRNFPRAMTRWLDSPAILRIAPRLAISNDPQQLGDLTLAMLDGDHGPGAPQIADLARFLGEEFRPDALIYSNSLLAGTLPQVRKAFSGPIYGVLQGDDLFLDGLPETHRHRAIQRTAELVRMFDGVIVHSRFYRDHMSAYLDLPADRFRLLTLGIDLEGHTGTPTDAGTSAFTVGYFARIVPEKGLHHLVEAFLRFHRRHREARLLVGGYLGSQNARYFREIQRQAAPLGAAFSYTGSPDTLAEKVGFYRQLHVLSVPTEFLEPKGLYVLEALANGVPVVQPEHGAFPEMIEATEGGLLVPPRDPQALADAWEQLAEDRTLRYSYGVAGQINVREKFSAEVMSRETLEIIGPAGAPRSSNAGT